MLLVQIVFIVYIKDTKNRLDHHFIVGPLFYQKVKSYITLSPFDYFTDKFFIHYSKGKCTHQVIGKNKISETPQIIAIHTHPQQRTFFSIDSKNQKKCWTKGSIFFFGVKVYYCAPIVIME